MKQSVIRDIFDGARGKRDTMKMKKEDDGKSKTLCDSYDELRKRLSPEQFALCQRFADALDGVWCDEVDFYFVEGFKLGLRVGIECMTEE